MQILRWKAKGTTPGTTEQVLRNQTAKHTERSKARTSLLRPKRPCMKPGCASLVTGRYCAEHQPKSTNVFKATHTQAWRAYSRAFLEHHPTCTDPDGRHRGIFVAATVTDHIRAHKGDNELFWDHANHQPLCNECNAAKCVKTEGGFGREIKYG